MISVTEAKQIVRNNIKPLAPVIVPLENAAGLVLAEDIYASIDIPAFNQSSMDGYAFRFEDFIKDKNFEIAGEVPAGEFKNFDNLIGKAVRIFTGAPVPRGLDTVVMQEKTTITNKNIAILDNQIIQGNNVRPVGAEIKAGSLALKTGAFLSPAAIGFLAGIGVSQAGIFPKPAATIIVTGNELQKPGQQLQPGQVYESNSYALKAALLQINIHDVENIFATDNINVLQKALENALQSSDIVLLTGGVSVGDYDFVLHAAELCGVQKMFHKVKQRPGKPLYFGKKENKVVFGLPGNPSSVLTCFYEYVMVAIEQLTMLKNTIKSEMLPLGKSCNKNTSLTHFLKGKKDGETVFPLDAQESFRMSSFANANCLIYIPEDKQECKEGDFVEVHLLPL